MATVTGNPKLADTVRMWRQIGGTVNVARRTGEFVFWHREVGSDRCNSRRKDTPRAIRQMLKRLVVMVAKGGRS
jgi:alkylated DNA nucleotide flippase Atl1